MQASAQFGSRSSRYAQSGAQSSAVSGRDELLAGSAAPTRPPPDKDAMDNRQLMTYAVDTHKETTASARRALQIVESTKQIQATTLENLKDQGDQMERVEANFDKIGSELTYSQRVLRAMRMCCCVDICCPGMAEPKRAEADANWRSGGAPRRAPSQLPRSTSSAPPRQGMSQASAAVAGGAPPPPRSAAAGGGFADPDADRVAGLGYEKEAQVIRGETQQQNQYLDEIASGLEQLKQGAYAMHDELGRQETHVDRLTNDAHSLDSRLNTLNRDGFKGM